MLIFKINKYIIYMFKPIYVDWVRLLSWVGWIECFSIPGIRLCISPKVPALVIELDAKLVVELLKKEVEN